jgi:hypothetical protein
MTAAEFRKNPQIPSKIAWMACHFSPYGTGLSNIPRELPVGSMLIVNDRTPICGHDPKLICQQLAAAVEAFQCSCIFLDMQRPGDDATLQLVETIVSALPCPVGVSHWYASGLDCPVCLPPLPMLTPLSQHLAPWKGREIWLELAPETVRYTITAAGCSHCDIPPEGEFPLWDPGLHCHYRIESEQDALHFILTRQQQELEYLIQSAENIQTFLGLYQELG